MDDWLKAHLVCPRDQLPVDEQDRFYRCPQGHSYPVVEGIPVMLTEEAEQTMPIATESMKIANGEKATDSRVPSLYIETVGVTDAEREMIVKYAETQPAIDPVVTALVAATNGIMYKHLIGKLEVYPIPDLPLENGGAKRLLDVGCSWGRWSIAASRRGYRVIGIDPSLAAVMAATRVAKQLGVEASFIVGDARFLPFAKHSFDAIFSYSVIQHFSKKDARRSVAEAGRILRPGGVSMVQMPSRFGLRCMYHQMRRGFSAGRDFDVRYWTLPELRKMFSQAIGPTALSVDCFFGLGLQKTDMPLMPTGKRLIIMASELLKTVTKRLSILKYVADSVWIRSIARPFRS